MSREFGVVGRVGKPRVSYREAITSSSRVQARFVRQTGGRGQYGDVWLEVEPRERGSGFVFENKIVGGAIPREYIPAVERGVREALENGPLGSFPLIDLKATLVDGSFHPVDSSEIAFKIAGSMALKEGVRRAHPVLLEPIMEVEVVTPEEYLGDVLGDLNSLRAIIRSIEGQEGIQVVKALIPLAETFGYTPHLRSLTQGRAVASMEFKSYEEVPQGLLAEAVKA